MNLKTKANKMDAGNGSYGICRVIAAARSPSPDPRLIRSSILLITCACMACSSNISEMNSRDRLVAGASTLTKKRDTWLAEMPRKFTIMSVAQADLPATLRDMGYTEATVDDGYVILTKGREPKKGTLVFTGPVRPMPILKRHGVQITDSTYPEIKSLTFDRRNAEQGVDGKTPEAPQPSR